jgi:hypothetical protein
MLLTIEGHPAPLEKQETTMTTNQTLAGRNVRKATMMVCGLGLLVVAAATKASAEISCPQWSSPVCTHWNLGPPASCAAWACAADKQTDPPKKVSLGGTNPVGRPIARPPIVAPRPVSRGPGTGAGTGAGAGTTTIYAKQAFSGSGAYGRR